MPYTLQHTAEAIDYKLNLIDKNKNLIPYPYQISFPAGLEDVGDGSVLTTNITAGTQELYLSTCVLPAGVYTASINVADVIDATKTVANPGFSLVLKTADDTGIGTLDGCFELTASTSIKIYLQVPSAFSTDLVVRPQIEEGTKKTTWVPYMDKIGNYVDERFNSVNTKIKVVADSVTLEHLGLKTKTLTFVLEDDTEVPLNVVISG